MARHISNEKKKRQERKERDTKSDNFNCQRKHKLAKIKCSIITKIPQNDYGFYSCTLLPAFSAAKTSTDEHLNTALPDPQFS